MRGLSRIAIGGLFVLIPLLIWLKKPHSPGQAESREQSKPPTVLAALGRVEGREAPISLGAATDGIVKEIFVTDGQRVSEGALLAVIGCEDIRAEIDLAKAQVDRARQTRVRLLRGHRNEEREAAAREADATKAVLTHAEEHLKRMDSLYQKGDLSRDEFEQTKRDFEVARANFEKALAEQNLVNAKPLPEEISQVDAEIAAAKGNVEVLTDKLEKCNVRAPISGVILKVMTKAGESYSTLLPRPLFTLADDSVRRVRAEVDERDIGKVKVGQASIITADAFPGERFEGQVIQISRAMQAKSVVNEDPSQKADRDVLDVIIELKPSQEDLPLGLRVTAQMTDVILSDEQPSSESSATPSDAQSNSSSAAASLATSEGPAEPSGFMLQAGAMKQLENADALAASLRKRTFPAAVLTREGDPFYRVDVGPYPDLVSARLAKEGLKKDGFETIIERQVPDTASYSKSSIPSAP